MGWTGIKAQIKIDFFRLLTLKIVLIFLSLTIARITGLEIDDTVYNSWTNVTMAMLPASSVKEGAEHFGNRRKEYKDYNERV